MLFLRVAPVTGKIYPIPIQETQRRFRTRVLNFGPTWRCNVSCCKLPFHFGNKCHLAFITIAHGAG